MLKQLAAVVPRLQPNEKVNMLKIAIVGAGYSGTALALNLYRQSKQPLEIYLCEKRGAFGLGDAYSTPYAFHLLNVRTEDMSAFDDEPHHFMDWLAAQPDLVKHMDQTQPLNQQFAPRLFYGKYLQAMLMAACENENALVKIKLIKADITDIDIKDQKAVLSSKEHAAITADKVVLALGNNPAGSFPFPVPEAMHTIVNPWDFTAPTQIKKDAAVLILGTGLSMIDTVLTLYHQKHRGPIYALSRRGLIPLPHAAKKSFHTLPADQLPAKVVHTSKFLRKHIAKSGDWRAVVDAFRKHITTTWYNASVADKKRFLRHLLPYWNVHRHRVHLEIAALLDKMVSNGQLQILAGRVFKVAVDHVQVQLRKQTKLTNLHIDWVINCMGPALNLKMYSPLLQSLHEQGIANVDELKIGLATNLHGALKIKAGGYSKMFYTLGALTRGTHWEITSVPDIRKQCHALAKELLI